MKGQRFWQAAFVVAFLTATYFLLSPGDRVPSVPLAASVPHFDKLEHAVVFAVLAVLARQAYPRSPAWGVFVALVIYGIGIEIAQRNIPGRSPDVLDAVADAFGAAAAFLVGAWGRVHLTMKE